MESSNDWIRLPEILSSFSSLPAGPEELAVSFAPRSRFCMAVSTICLPYVFTMAIDLRSLAPKKVSETRQSGFCTLSAVAPEA
jgi:hypothetical protein